MSTHSLALPRATADLCGINFIAPEGVRHGALALPVDCTLADHFLEPIQNVTLRVCLFLHQRAQKHFSLSTHVHHDQRATLMSLYYLVSSVRMSSLIINPNPNPIMEIHNLSIVFRLHGLPYASNEKQML